MISFPQLSEDNCENHEEALAARNRGLPFTRVVCPQCAYRDGCTYWEQRKAANRAKHAVATQHLGAVSLPEIADGRGRIMLHESPLDVLRPSYVARNGMWVVKEVANAAAEDTADPMDRCWFRHLGLIAGQLHGELKSAVAGSLVDLPKPKAGGHVPSNPFPALNEAARELAGSGAILAGQNGEAMRLALAAALDDLRYVAVLVDEQPNGKRPDGKVKVKLDRRLVGIVKHGLPRDCWLSDATADKGELEAALGCRVVDITPPGRLFLHHPVRQIVSRFDVTKAREPAKVLPLLRGIFHDLPYRKIGLLTHKHLAKELPGLLDEADRERLAMTAYFGGGLTRGSNLWLEACDCLLVLGTPRCGAGAVRTRLLQLNKVRAALQKRDEANWGADWWSGVTETGKRRTVRCWHYADHDWHRAYLNIVRAELVQAIGRGRGIMPEGIPVFVVTNENPAQPGCEDGRHGFLLADEGRFTPLTDAQAKVLNCFRGESGKAVYPRSAAIAKKLEISQRWANKLLRELETAGRVQRIGKCRWCLVNREKRNSLL